MANDSIWQQVFDEVKVRLATIRTVNGYETELGGHVFAWRDLEKSPFTEAEMPCCMVRDLSRESAVDGVHATLNTHKHLLTVEIFAQAMASQQAPPDNFARRMLCDIDRAIGMDRRWSGLARDTLPITDVMETAHSGDRIVGVRKTFSIIFRTGQFDPFNQ